MTRYRIVPERSRLWADARSSLHPIHVETKGFEGYIDVEIADGHLDLRTAPQAHVEIDAGRLKSGNALYDYELERRLEVRKYPRLKGDVKQVDALDSGDRYRVTGELLFHGVAGRVQGEVTVRVHGDTLEVEGEQVIDMRNFGLDPPRILMLRVQPEVHVRANVIAERER